ncbi:MAG TPA: nucleoside transporter C-terminal domain-containing protein [Thermoanaerobaculia bacterium]|nr:nucleoside transporter C-terminal domain-containing protein [Thermoanaerobaculia bacterium]
MGRFTGLIGIALILCIAYVMSSDRRAIKWRVVMWGVGLQVVIAIAVLKGILIEDMLRPIQLPLSRIGAVIVLIVVWLLVAQLFRRISERGTRRILGIASGIVIGYLLLAYSLLAYLFETMRVVVNNFIGYTAEGSKFVFGEGLASATGPVGFVFATQVLPTIIFISSIFAVLYYLGVMQMVVRFFARIMTRTMGASGAESTSTAASIFMGQTEAPLTIRPFLPDVTMSELMVIMVAGMATVSGGIMAAYVLVANVDIVHLLTASIMAAPAAIMLAKMMVPEKEVPKTGSDVNFEVPKMDVNVIDAAGRGAIEGLHLALNVAGMLIAFIALVALINGLFGYAHGWLTGVAPAVAAYFPASLDILIGWIFRPIAWAIGVTWKDSFEIGNLLGTRMVLNEFVAFVKLGGVRDQLDPRSLTIVTYALCGFANFSSIAIQIGGIGSLAPTRRGDLAKLGLRAMIAGTLANFMTAAIAGILF